MASALEPLGVIPTAHLFLPLHRELMTLLEGLTADEWCRPTLARRWTVRDIAAHLLDDDVRRLSFQRDRHAVPQPSEPVASFSHLVTLLNDLNADWLRAMQRVSPAVLMSLIAVTGPQVAALFESLDPHAPAFFPVAWAGETTSETWFDIGRDYTERWHHQAQIREAVGAPPLDGPVWLRPVIELSVKALPRVLADARAAPGTSLVFHVTGAAGGAWSIIRSEKDWLVYRGMADSPAARVACDADAAWRLFFNALSGDDVRRRIIGEGDQSLIAKVQTVRAVMV